MDNNEIIKNYQILNQSTKQIELSTIKVKIKIFNNIINEKEIIDNANTKTEKEYLKLIHFSNLSILYFFCFALDQTTNTTNKKNRKVRILKNEIIDTYNTLEERKSYLCEDMLKKLIKEDDTITNNDTILFDEKVFVFMQNRNLSIENTELKKDGYENSLNRYLFWILKIIQYHHKINISKQNINLAYYLSYLSEPSEYKRTINNYLLYYFSLFTSINLPSKSSINSDLDRIETEKYFLCKESSIESREKFHLDSRDILYLCSYENIFRSSDKSKQTYFLINKIFYNDSPMYKIYDGYHEENGTIVPNFRFSNASWKTSYEIYKDLVLAYEDTLKDNPGIISFLYMLTKEMTNDEIYLLFPNNKSETQKKQELNNIKLFEKLIKKYDTEKPVKDTLTEVIQKEIQYNQEDNDNFKYNSQILFYLIYFTIWEKMGYFSINYDDFLYDYYNKLEFRDTLIKPFFDSLYNSSMPSNENIINIFNKVSSYLGFNKQDEIPNIDFASIEDNNLFVNLLCNFSKIKTELKLGLISQSNLLRNIQKQFCPLNRNINKSNKLNSNKLNKLINNQKFIQQIDFGFKIENYITRIYPVNSPKFKEASNNKKFDINEKKTVTDLNGNVLKSDEIKRKFKENEERISTFEPAKRIKYNYHREINCKFLFETDAIFEEKAPTKFDFIKTYSIALKNRYLYTDRNMSEHYSKHNIVQNLLTFNKKQDLKFILNEAKKIFNMDGDESIGKIYILEKIDILLKQIELSKNKYTDLIKLDIEDMLNVIFSVNGNNENGFEHNSIDEDFYILYNPNLSLYLTYLTFKFYDKFIKS